jgi:hypothetical protein
MFDRSILTSKLDKNIVMNDYLPMIMSCFNDFNARAKSLPK